MITDYEKQAQDFLIDCGATIEITKLGTFKYWPDAKEARDVYEFCIKSKVGHEYHSRFGDSLHNTAINKIAASPFGFTREDAKAAGIFYGRTHEQEEKTVKIARILKPVRPGAYGILAGLTHHDPGTFENFCSDYGYDTDSRKAFNVYQAVIDEWSGVCRVFDAEQRGKLAEIN